MEQTQSYAQPRLRKADVRQEVARQRPAKRINVGNNERMVSVVAGSTTLLLGLLNRSLTGKVAAALGGGLVYRGITGHCAMYEALGVDRAEEPRARQALGTGERPAPRHYDVLRSATVQKPAAEVLQAWQSPELVAQAMSHFATLSSGAAGQTRWTIHDALGREHSWETKLSEEPAAQRLRWTTSEDAALVKTVTLTLQAAPGDRGTEMTLHIRIERMTGVLAPVLAKLLGPAPAWLAERALTNMKCLLEAGELPSLKNNPAAR